MTNQLDERIDYHQGIGWTDGQEVERALFHGIQYQGIANTIVQLIRRNTSGVIAASQQVRLEARLGTFDEREVWITMRRSGSLNI